MVMCGDKNVGRNHSLRLIIDHLKCGTVTIIWNNLKKSKFHSAGNK
jgi:hypothetical protein